MSKPIRWDGAEDLTPQRIVQIARAKGFFSVSWRYRDDSLRKRCARLRRAGVLARVKCPPGEDRYRYRPAAGDLL